MTGKVETEEHKRHISEGHIRSFLEHEAKHEYHYPKTKRCSQCKKRKPRDSFLKKKTTLKSGIIRRYLSSECRKCSNERAKRWRDRHKKNGTSSDLYRKYESRRSAKSKQYQKQLRKESDAIRRRDRGAKSRAKPEPSIKGKRLPREPFIGWLKEEMERRKISEQDLSIQTGVDSGHINEMLSGAYYNSGRGKDSAPGSTTILTRISLGTVDKILFGLDRQEMLTILYPE